MTETQIYENIKQAISSAPRNSQTMEMHLQMIKYADHLKNVTAKEFCEGVGLKASFATEFSKMRNLTERLKAPDLIPRSYNKRNHQYITFVFQGSLYMYL